MFFFGKKTLLSLLVFWIFTNPDWTLFPSASLIISTASWGIPTIVPQSPAMRRLSALALSVFASIYQPSHFQTCGISEADSDSGNPAALSLSGRTSPEQWQARRLFRKHDNRKYTSNATDWKIKYRQCYRWCDFSNSCPVFSGTFFDKTNQMRFNEMPRRTTSWSFGCWEWTGLLSISGFICMLGEPPQAKTDLFARCSDLWQLPVWGHG